MKQLSLLAGAKIRPSSHIGRKQLPNKLNKAFGFLLFSLLLSPVAANATDITEQLHYPQIDKKVLLQSRDEADTLLRLGERQNVQGNSHKAVKSLLQALEIYHSIGDLDAIGLTYEFLGKGYIQLKQYKKAEDAIRRRLAIARDTKDFQSQIFALNNIGTLLLQKGEFETAANTFEEAIIIARNIDNDEGYGISLSNLGLATARLGNYNRAVKLY